MEIENHAVELMVYVIASLLIAMLILSIIDYFNRMGNGDKH